MNRKRLRPAYTESELRRIYSEPHDHTKFEDHRVRVEKTIALGQKCVGAEKVRTVIDLSAGNASIPRGIEQDSVPFVHLGDFAQGYEYTGPIENTIGQLSWDMGRIVSGATSQDEYRRKFFQLHGPTLFVCSETIEHLDEPVAVLKEIRKLCTDLILSTPIDAFEDDNPEHYWAWSREGVEEMLTEAGFSVVEFEAVDTRPMGPYVFGIWWAK